MPGFHDGVAPGLLDLAWASIQECGAAEPEAAEAEFSLEGYRSALGVPALTATAGTRELLEARWCRPSLSIVDMRPGVGGRGGDGGGGGTAAGGADACYRWVCGEHAWWSNWTGRLALYMVPCLSVPVHRTPKFGEWMQRI